MKTLLFIIFTSIFIAGCGAKSKPLTQAGSDLPNVKENIQPELSPSPIPSPVPSTSPLATTCHAYWVKDTFAYSIQNPGNNRVAPFETATLKIEASNAISPIIPVDVISFTQGVVFLITGASFSTDRKTLSVTGYFDDPTPSNFYTVQSKISDNSNQLKDCTTDNIIKVTRNVSIITPPVIQCSLSATPSTVTAVLGAAGAQVFYSPSTVFKVTVTGGAGTLEPFGVQQIQNFQADPSPASPSNQIIVTGYFKPPFYAGDYQFTAKVKSGADYAYCSTTVKLLVDLQPWVQYFRHSLMGSADAAGNQDVIDWDYTSSKSSPSGFQLSSNQAAFQLRTTPSGVWDSGLYRCRVLNIPVVRHFLSADPGCEAPNGTPDPIFDYTSTLTHLLGFKASSSSGTGAFLLKRATRDLNFGNLNHVLTFLAISDFEFYSGSANIHYTLGGPLGWVIP